MRLRSGIIFKNALLGQRVLTKVINFTALLNSPENSVFPQNKSAVLEPEGWDLSQPSCRCANNFWCNNITSLTFWRNRTLLQQNRIVKSYSSKTVQTNTQWCPKKSHPHLWCSLRSPAMETSQLLWLRNTKTVNFFLPLAQDSKHYAICYLMYEKKDASYTFVTCILLGGSI